MAGGGAARTAPASISIFWLLFFSPLLCPIGGLVLKDSQLNLTSAVMMGKEGRLPFASRRQATWHSAEPINICYVVHKICIYFACTYSKRDCIHFLFL